MDKPAVSCQVSQTSKINVITRLDRVIQKKGTGFGACSVLDTGVKPENDEYCCVIANT